MKGIVFNLLEDFITENFGAEAFEDIYDGATLQTTDPFVGPGKYPDSDFLALVGGACQKLGITADVASRKFGEFCFPKLTELHPNFLDGISDAKSFLKTVDGVIHVEVHKLHPGAELPKFDYVEDQPGLLGIKYTSPKKLCHFMEGLIDGCATHFGESVVQTQEKCYHRGDDHCLFKLKFS